MVRLRVFSGRELCRLLGDHGFEVVRQRGSHAVMQKRTAGTTVTDPVPQSLLLKDPFTPGGLKRADLECGVLHLGRNAGVAEAHGCKSLLPFGAIVQYLFATRQPLQRVGRVGVA
ncbi:MAG: type II toxin-antitoxin system HicA family toxin [Candidatus Accumulibacter sp.]|uniref:Type II toxin-antitoxin system HicA family toxin n=1 Tax=Candidatus Accumulibacter affinis TaxID=2954384 RepID=A0A935W3X6_9PROT|nr:type II toxin-antitoxin system HicA family toxin [Candidatus Accumulibacter affinis]